MSSNTRGRDGLAGHVAADLDGTFTQIVTTYGKAIYSTALRLSRQPADAEDLAAETFVRAYQALKGYPPERTRALALRPWLVTITLNLWRNQMRDATRRPSLVALHPGVVEPDPHPGPDQTFLDASGSSDVETLLARLPDAQRLSVLLRHVVGLSYAEIALALGYPVGTVKSHVSRGLATLRAQLCHQEETTS